MNHEEAGSSFWKQPEIPDILRHFLWHKLMGPNSCPELATL